jgi:hypothetical protein
MSTLERTPDFEIKKILQCLKTNGYEFEYLEDSDSFQGCMNAYFNKDVVQFIDIDGNNANDSHINIKVEFDARMDPEHSYYDEDNNYIPNLRRGHDFISTIFDELEGGKRKTKRNKSRQKNKSKRNKSKRMN